MSGSSVASPGWRYVLLALGFAALAVVRFVDGSLVWGLVFTTAAGTNIWLSVTDKRPSRQHHREAPLPDCAELRRSWRVHHESIRGWRTLAVITAATSAGLLLVQPSLAALAAVTALCCLFRARRTRHDADTLRRTLVTSSGETPS